MKKSILSFVFVMAFATIASAAPRFGVIGEQFAGLGAFITDDIYNFQLTFYNNSNDASAKTETTAVKVGGNYKVALDSVTALTVGVSYETKSGKSGGTDNADDNTIALVAGFERALSSNVILTADINLYEQKTYGDPEIKKNFIFQNSAIGVAYLF